MNTNKDSFLQNINRSIKRKQNNFGFIEFISNGEVSGWAYSDKSEVNYVGFFIGKKLISFKPLDINRPDINNKFNIDKPTGFRLLFDYKMGKKFNKETVKFCALDLQKNILFKLNLINKIKNINLRQFVVNPYFGYDGRIDEINPEGLITGWAAKRSYKEKINIWLQSESKKKPLSIICNIWRQDLNFFDVKDCGFEINPQDLYSIYKDEKIYFSFDKEGKYNIDPRNVETTFKSKNPEILKVLSNLKSQDKENYIKLEKSTLPEKSNKEIAIDKNYLIHKNELLELRNLLNELEADQESNF